MSVEPVLIVGAGPAGATAARTLALAGMPVRLLDRAAFPRNKPCGGGISMRVVARFPYLHDALTRIPTHRISRLHLEGPEGISTVIESGQPAALMIRRVDFDHLLLSLAIEAGAEVITGADIVGVTENAGSVKLTARDGRCFSAPVVIAADGVHSVIGRRLGLNRGWPAQSIALDMMEETPRTSLRDVDSSTLWAAYGYPPEHGTRTSGAPAKRAAEGYAYVFPKHDYVNIGIGYVLSYFRREVKQQPYEVQRTFVDALSRRGVTEGQSVRSNFTPFLIPVGGPLRKPARGRVLLAGDAGGFVNGLTAEGIYYAMVSGELAAQSILASSSTAEGLARRYCRACDRELGGELRDSVLLQRYLFADGRRIARVIKGARRDAALTRLVLDFAVGRLTYRALKRKTLARSPLLALRLAMAHAGLGM